MDAKGQVVCQHREAKLKEMVAKYYKTNKEIWKGGVRDAVSICFQSDGEGREGLIVRGIGQLEMDCKLSVSSWQACASLRSVARARLSTFLLGFSRLERIFLAWISSVQGV